MICIINCGSAWFPEIKNRLAEFKQPFETTPLNKIPQCDFKLYSGIIISGSPDLLTQVDQQKHQNLFSFIKKLSIPILGICFGHQIIGLLYNAEIKHDNMIDKKEKIQIVNPDILFSSIPNNPIFREKHTEYTTLPKNFLLLAKSSSCQNEAMKHKTKNLYGVQFHPETSGNNGKTLLKNFLNLC